jgi:hypothetical protein
MAKKVHGDAYDYSMTEYVAAKKKVKIACRKHGEFLTTPDNHIRRASGCPKCGHAIGGEKTSLRLMGKTHNNFIGSCCRRRDDFLLKSKRVHGDRYDYSLVEYKSGKKLVKLICEKHGVFETLPSRHLLGHGCPKCAREEHRRTQSEFVRDSVRTHSGKYNYDKAVYQIGRKPVSIVCPLHGEFQQKPNKHLSGHGCSKCNSSHGERLIRQWLIEKAVGFEEQKVFPGCVNPVSGCHLRFDFYIPSLTTCVEFDGEQHFRPWRDGRILAEQVAKIQFRDSVKDDFCKSEGIRLLRIPYSALGRVSDILERELAA